MIQPATARPLADEIREAVERGIVSLPPLPAVATKVQSLLRDEEHADPRTVAAVVKNDPALAAALLRMSNSAAFSGLRAISDVSQAIARLGLRQVGSVVAAVTLKGHFESKDPQKLGLFQALWDHAVATALVTRRLTGTHGGDPEEAFLAGLLHDTGKLLVLRALETVERNASPLTACVLEELMDALHAELGHRTLVAWKIPAPVCLVALHHHDPDPPATDTLLLRVQVANAITKKLGAHPKPEPELNLLDLPAVERLNLRDLEIASLMVELEDEIVTVRSLL